VPALDMNGKEKETFHQKKWAFSWFLKLCRVSDDWILAGCLFLYTANKKKSLTVQRNCGYDLEHTGKARFGVCHIVICLSGQNEAIAVVQHFSCYSDSSFGL